MIRSTAAAFCTLLFAGLLAGCSSTGLPGHATTGVCGVEKVSITALGME